MHFSQLGLAHSLTEGKGFCFPICFSLLTSSPVCKPSSETQSLRRFVFLLASRHTLHRNTLKCKLTAAGCASPAYSRLCVCGEQRGGQSYCIKEKKKKYLQHKTKRIAVENSASGFTEATECHTGDSLVFFPKKEILHWISVTYVFVCSETCLLLNGRIYDWNYGKTEQQNL